MRFDVVRLGKILLIALSSACLMGSLSFGQDAQTGRQSQPTPRTTQTAPEQDRPFRRAFIVPSKPEEKASQVADDLLIFKAPSKLPPEAVQKALQEAARQRLTLLAGNSQRQGQGEGLDPGIYARQADGAKVCGAIISYNFSAGENPQLQSVTTCTPSNAVTTLRARAPKTKPAGPQVLQTVYQEQEKK